MRLDELAVVNILAAFPQRESDETAEQEALKVLKLIVDTDADEKVRESAGKAMSQSLKHLRPNIGLDCSLAGAFGLIYMNQFPFYDIKPVGSEG